MGRDSPFSVLRVRLAGLFLLEKNQENGVHVCNGFAVNADVPPLQRGYLVALAAALTGVGTWWPSPSPSLGRRDFPAGCPRRIPPRTKDAGIGSQGKDGTSAG